MSFKNDIYEQNIDKALDPINSPL